MSSLQAWLFTLGMVLIPSYSVFDRTLCICLCLLFLAVGVQMSLDWLEKRFWAIAKQVNARLTHPWTDTFWDI
ncbi:hypothetical protein GOODEAATRI_018518 [Goodea atripinnis]|uniref:Uncharacterized protein n=1 Tax=Goodea atripinnis TaxID=208336 RepID=A0ABV0NLA4_9TELE